MSNPFLARTADDGRRFYVFGQPVESFWSVTTLINGGVPKYLHAHYAKLAAELAYEEIIAGGPSGRVGPLTRRLARKGREDVVMRQARGELTSIKLHKLTERDLALRWIKGAADRHRDAARDKGTAVHAEAERVVLEYAREAARLSLEGKDLAPWPQEIAAYQPGFERWVNDFQPEFLAAEASVFNRRQAYAGTLDTIVRLTQRDGSTIVVIVDFKTGKDVYAEVALQLAAYSRAEFMAAPDYRTELAMPGPIVAGAVLHLLPGPGLNGLPYRFQYVRIDDPIFAAFCYAREVFRFNDQIAKTVFLQDVEPDFIPGLRPAAEVA